MKRRWKITREWRQSTGYATILDEPQPYYDLIKQAYPHFHYGKSRNGENMYVYPLIYPLSYLLGYC